jgi:hypothetical protein
VISAGAPPVAYRWWLKADRAADGLAADLGLYLISAAFAAITATTSTLLPHRAWGAVATVGYACATLIVTGQLIARWRGGAAARLAGPAIRSVVTLLTWAATALVPMVLQSAQRADGRIDRAQEEVIVIERAGSRLLEHGSPYLGHEAIAALPPGEQLLGYFPYQPGMAVFGLPHAVAGSAWWTDARLWFALATAVALALAVGALRRSGPPLDPGAGDVALLRAVQFATVLPICALTLATGGDDIPVLALCLLALALCATRRPGAAGLAIGLAAALKLFAWPVLLALLVHAGTRGWRPAARFAAAAIGLPVVTLVPAQLVDSAALVENVLHFPLGEGVVSSPAASALPGHLIASGLPGGRAVAAALLAAAGLAIAVHLARRPPRAAATTATICGYGLLAAILLMPSTRFGYLLYPAALLAWAPALRLAESRLEVPAELTPVAASTS